ncbi:MAG: DNA polymerase III subunit beta [Verrucomicrobiota bacterium]
MKITIPKNVLVEALAIAKRVVSNRSTLPILSNVRVAVSPGRMELTCTNLDQELRVVLCLGVKTEDEADGGQFCVKAALFHDIIKALHELDSACEVVLRGSEGEPISISSHDSFYTLGILPAAEFPPSPVLGDDAQSLAMGQGNLLNLVASTSSAMSEDENRFVLCGALLELADDFRCVATDGRRLMLADHPAMGLKKPTSLLIPRPAVGHLLALLSTDTEKTVDLSFDGKAARFTWDGSAAAQIVFTTKLVEGAFPNYRALLDSAKAGVPCGIGRPELLAAVERVSLVNEVILLTFKGTRLKVAATNNPKDAPASAEEVLPCEKAKSVRIQLQSGFLLDALRAVDTPQIVLNIIDSTSVLTMNTPQGHWQTLIMPMRQDQPQPAPTEDEKAESEETANIQPSAPNSEVKNDFEGAKLTEKGKAKIAKAAQRKVLEAEVTKAREDAEAANQAAKAKVAEPEKLIDLAIKAISDEGKCSVSLLQRWFKLSYYKAGDLLDELQAAKIVGMTIKTGPGAGTQPILITLPR